MPSNFARDYGIRQKLIKDVNAKDWRYLGRRWKATLSEQKIFADYQRERDRLYDYYCLACNVSTVMGQVDYMLMYSCLHTLATKYKSSIRKEIDKRRLPNKDWGVVFATPQGEKLRRWKRPLVTKRPKDIFRNFVT
jgi:hypothetical protein